MNNVWSIRLEKRAVVMADVVALLISVVVMFTLISAARAETTIVLAIEQRNPGVALSGEECRVNSRDEWTGSEKWVWEQICEGQEADFNVSLNVELDPRNPNHDDLWLDERRRLSPDFLRTIFLYEPFRSAIPYRGVHIHAAYFKYEIDLIDASIEWPLVLTGSRFKSGAAMRRFTTPAFVSFAGSKFDGNLIMDSSSIEGRLVLRKAAFVDVDLKGAQIGDWLSMNGSTFTGQLDMSSASIGGSLIMQEAAFVDVDLKRVKISDWLSMKDSIFCQLDMSSASIGGSLIMKGAKLDKPANLKYLSVGSFLDAQDVTLSELDLTGAQINGELRLGSSSDGNIEGKDCKDQKGRKDQNENLHVSKLTLRNTSVGVLQDTKTSWPDNLEREFEGFTYDRLGESGYDRESSWFIDWLEKDKSYSPEPYRHLAGVLRTAGHEDVADAVLFASRERERKESNLSLAKWLTLWALKLSIGYGYCYFLALFWIALLVVIGTFILDLVQEHERPSIISGLLDSAFYSLDMLLPVIRLRERHYCIDLTTWWARYYFYFHKVMGYVLVFFVIAGLSGLTE